jgi:UDP-glucose:(heptosyl)LPS alpha-1,3-glucosyltransferase
MTTVLAGAGRRLRVAMVALDFNREGGSEGRTGHLVDRLVADGHEVHLLGARIRDAWDARVVRRPIAVPEHPHWLEVLLFARRAALLLARERYDVVHNQLRPFVPGIVTVGGGCHRFYLREVLPLEGRGLAGLRALLPLHQVILALERKNLRPDRCPYIIANSALGRAGILRYYPFPPERVIVAHNGVDAERFSPEGRAGTREATRAALGVAPDELLLLFVGGGFARKGLGVLLEALSRLSRQESLRLAVLGRGSPGRWQRQAARLGLGGRTSFTGPVRDAARYYAAADLFVLPTLFDPFANATLEAMASGLPVVTTSRNGAAEILTPGADGMVIPDPRDAGALADALAALCDPGRRAAMGARARETALRYSWQGPLEETLRVYAAATRLNVQCPMTDDQ